MAVIAYAAMVLLTSLAVHGHPHGAPDVACTEMKPHHPKTTTTGTPPFAVNLTEIYYKPGDVISGTLYSPTGEVFRGFLIQARISDGSSTDPLGEFVDLEPYSHTVCGQNERGGLTHNNNTEKDEVQFTWRAPYQAAGDIHFKVTVVQHYNPSRYWMGIVSDTVIDCSLTPAVECEDISSVTPGFSTIPTTQITTKKPSGKIPLDPDCGVTKGCFPACPATGCEFLVTWQAENHTVKFTLQMVLSNMDGIWMAVGISPADKMDSSNAAACLHANGKISMQSSHNIGHKNHKYADATFGILAPAGSSVDGVFSCEWSRMMRMNESTFLDIADKDYYILVGTGPVVGGVMHQHFQIPFRSTSKVNFTRHHSVGEDTSTSTLIKLHASLMTIAWIILSSVGVVAARHCKNMLESKLLFKLKIWFQIHRTCMVLAVLCVVAAFVVIFVEIKGFSQINPPQGKEYTKAHPYLGIIVTTLTLLNPTMALFRPAPDAEKRYIFNWAHFTVGTSAHILAVITICFGVGLEKAGVDTSALYVLVLYSAVFVVVQTVLEIHGRHRKSGYEQVIDSKANTTISASVKMPAHPESHFHTYVLALHAILMVAFGGLLVAMICSPSTFQNWFRL